MCVKHSAHASVYTDVRAANKVAEICAHIKEISPCDAAHTADVSAHAVLCGGAARGICAERGHAAIAVQCACELFAICAN